MKTLLSQRIKALILSLLTAPFLMATPTEFWISPNGSDSGAGSQGDPWLTIQHARDYIRTNNLNVGMTDDIIVNIAAGEYYISSPITFSAADSGSNGHYVRYRASDGTGTAVIIGGTPVTSWSIHSGNIWKSTIGTIPTFSTMYENGKRARLARTPNFKPQVRYPGALEDYFLSVNGSATSLIYNPAHLNPSSWTLTSQAQVWWWVQQAGKNWGLAVCPITSINTGTNTINYDDALAPSASASNERYFIQGVFELLDSPGEFFYDPSAGVLYYWPMDGDPNRQRIIRPEANVILDINGGAIGTHTSFLQFIGLSIRCTDFVADDVRIVGEPRAAIYMEHTNHIEVIDCHLFNLGNLAIRMINDCNNNTVYGCWIERTGEGGIQLFNDLDRTNYPTAKNEHNLISNCLLHDLTEVRITTHLGGIQLYNVSDCDVSYCDISNAGRYATTLRGNYSQMSSAVTDANWHPSKNNIFEYLRVQDCATDSGDVGVVHAAHVNKTNDPNINYWNQILIGRAYATPSMTDYAPKGIFLDHPHSAENQSLSNIKIAWTQGVPFGTNNNPIQTLNNVSWTGTFNEAAIQYANIGIKSDFPKAYLKNDGVVLVDDRTVTFSTTGGWPMGGTTDKYGDTMVHTSSNNVADTAEWRPIVTSAGDYSVWIWKVGYHQSSTTAANYDLVYNGGSTSQVVDQKSNTARWERFGSGTYNFATGTSGYLKLYANGGNNKYVRADAMRIQKVGAGPGSLGDEIAWWKLDDSGFDLSTRHHYAAPKAGAAFTSSSRIGSGAISLNGTDQYVEVADRGDLDLGTGDFSISLWFYRTPDSSSIRRIISKGAGNDGNPGYAIWASDSTLKAAIGDGSSPRIIQEKAHAGTNTWNHVVVTFARSGDMTIYINGSANPATINISSLSSADIKNNYKLTLGRNASASNLFWLGMIDDVRIYKRVLTPWEVDMLSAP